MIKTENRKLELEKPKRKLIDKEYKKSLDWSKLKCKSHPKRQAVIQFNPPIGGFFCNECLKEMQKQKIRNMGVGYL